MAHVMEVDAAFDPVGIGFFGADGVVFEADGVAPHRLPAVDAETGATAITSIGSYL